MSRENDSAAGLVWCNGFLVPASDVRLSIADRGFTHGAGLFETLLACDGRPKCFPLHWQRLARSAAALGIPLASADDLFAACCRVAAAQPMPRARLRITHTAGAGDGLELGVGGATTLITVAPAPDYAAPARLAIVAAQRNQRSATAGLKTTSYLENLLALAEARARGADEALMLNVDGMLCEGATSNLWYVLDGRLCTPGLGSGCLPGVAREMLLELCAALGVEVDTADRPAAALAGAEAVFLSSALRGVQPVGDCDGRVCPLATDHPLVRRLAGLFVRARDAGCWDEPGNCGLQARPMEGLHSQSDGMEEPPR